MNKLLPGFAGRSWQGISGSLLILLLACSPAHAAPKTDIVILKNGDRLTGEIKKLEYGVLTLSTDSIGTVSIEWPSVARVQTNQLLEVERSDGSRQYGQVPKLGESGVLALAEPAENDSIDDLPLESVVHMVPISQGSWLDRVDANVSLGVSASSANQDRQYTVNANVTFRKPTRYWNINYNGSRTDSTNNDSSSSNYLNAQFRWLRDNRWYWAATGGLTTNEQTDLNLRTVLGGGIGRYWVRTEHQEFTALTGIAGTRENYTDGISQISTEGVLQLNYQYFSFNDPNLGLSTALSLYPSLTIAGRLRSQFDITGSYEIFKDFTYQLSYTRSHDSKPPAPDLVKTDWSLTSSFGYNF
ncbi:DUF481 domain-containing protein [Dokdonella sp.]|uniref:DUF481 domain-containing protein n=1 Tax=Dokdonella sp. TaxID=2291710 RepID=UPI003526F72A